MKVTIEKQPPIPQPDKVVLEMTIEEAQLLKSLVGKLGGEPFSDVTTMYDMAISLSTALGQVNIQPSPKRFTFLGNGSYFYVTER